MAEKERPSGLAISNAIRAQRQSSATTDRSNLKDTLVKSSLWKKKTLERIETARSRDAANGETVVLPTDQPSFLDIAEQHWQELVSDTDSNDHELLQRRSKEIERLQQKIEKLEAENVRLLAQHQEELDARSTELLEFQDAYNQFQRESDLLLNELVHENECLRAAEAERKKRI
ncbi:MAG: hypothetical protein ACR2QI_04325 [Woeseiaceae bacterium]